MNTHAHLIPPSAAASSLAAVTHSLELIEARQLRDALSALLRREQAAMADFLVALADFDCRRGWETLGHASLFAFLHVELGLSRSAAFWRLSAARLLQRLPVVIEPLRDGRLCLSTTAELAKILTEENQAEVLPRYFSLSAREAAEVTAALAPRQRPPLRTVVTRPEQVSVLPPATPATPESLILAATRTHGSVLTSEPNPAHPARDVERRREVEPLTADLSRLHMTVSREFLKKLDSARDGLSHSVPGATVEQVLEAALDLLLEKRARARGQAKKPRTATRAPTTVPSSENRNATPPEQLHRRTGPREHIPTAVRRAVWERDQGKCAWPLDGGGVCGSSHRLEFDHVEPWAKFSNPTEDNLRLLCHAHNQLAARQAFGERCMKRYAGRRVRAAPTRSVHPTAGPPRSESSDEPSDG